MKEDGIVLSRPICPIDEHEVEIAEKIKNNPVVVLSAPTGSGKSTRIAGILLRAGLGKKGLIGITEPRRIATMSVCAYSAELENATVGGVFGYQFRGDNKTSKATKVKFMTEGILLRELHSDPQLMKYSVIVVDEAHERGVNQDLIIALLKKLRVLRPEMKIIIMSATIDEDRFATHFADADGKSAPVIKVPGQMFDVETRWPKDTPYGTKAMVEACVTMICDTIIGGGEKGDILAFMPDEQTIKQVCGKVEEQLKDTVRILPLYGSQAPDEQRRVFERNGKRRVIVATNIAETSITVDGVIHVVDSGLIKAIQYVNASMSALTIMEHSKAGCRQRKGRGGRTQPGVYWPLFDETNFNERPDYTEPELKRMTLDQILLHLRTLDYSMDEVLSLEFMDPPGDTRWKEAEDRLKILGALDAEGTVTEDGQRMEKLPVAPMLGRMILNAVRHGCLQEIVTIVAALTARSAFVRPRGKEQEANAAQLKFKDPTSDALTVLKVWEAWNEAGENGKRNAWARDNYLSSRALSEVDRNRDQMIRILKGEDIEITSSTDKVAIRKAVAAGLIVNLCTKQGRYDYAWQNETVFIHPGSALFGSNPQMMVCSTVVSTTKAYARDCTSIDRTWLDELIPESARTKEWEIREPYGYSWSRSNQPQIIERMTWHGTVLKEEVVTSFPDAALPFFARRLLNEFASSMIDPIHPQSPMNRSIWLMVLKALGITGFASLLDPYQFANTNNKELKEIAERLLAFFTERLTGAHTLEEVQLKDIALKLEDWISPELLAKHQVEIETDKAREERARKIREENEACYRTEQAERLARRGTAVTALNEKIGGFEARLKNLTGPIAIGLRSQLASLQERLEWDSEVYISGKIAGLEQPIAQLEREQGAGKESAEQIWKTVLAAYPVCPLCGKEWSSSGPHSQILICDSTAHDMRRFLSLNLSKYASMVGEFLTDRDESVAKITISLSAVAIQFTVPRTSFWTGKKFKTVRFVEKAAILSEALVKERTTIVSDLAELQKAKQELESIKKTTSGLMLLTFKIRNGEAFAQVGGTTYKAAYTANYPAADGERWFCKIGASFGGNTEATTTIKANSIASNEDVEALRGLIRETYPGLPESLLV